jgi:hypothetical protein
MPPHEESKLEHSSLTTQTKKAERMKPQGWRQKNNPVRAALLELKLHTHRLLHVVSSTEGARPGMSKASAGMPC